MTAAAHSPEPAKRSKRMYVLWAVALGFLVTAGLVCWFVVVPHLQTRAVLAEVYNNRLSDTAAIERLGGPVRTIERLKTYLRITGSSARCDGQGWRLMSHCGSPAVPHLIEGLDHSNANVRDWAALGLGRIGPQAADAIPALVKALQDRDEHVRTRAAWALETMGPAARDAVPALILAIPTTQSDMGCAASDALRKIGPASPKSIPALRQALQNPDGEVCYAAAKALIEIEAKGRSGKYPTAAADPPLFFRALDEMEERVVVAVLLRLAMVCYEEKYGAVDDPPLEYVKALVTSGSGNKPPAKDLLALYESVEKLDRDATKKIATEALKFIRSRWKPQSEGK
jgi:HEAT repeats